MPRSSSFRSAVRLANSLHRDLSRYAIAAGAAGVSTLALAPPANAQIVYTPAHEKIDHDQKMLIDFNHDGIADLAIREVPSNWFGATFPGNSLLVVPRTRGGIKLGIGVDWASAMSEGQQIGPSDAFFSGAALMDVATNYGIYYTGSWGGLVQARYLGIRFLINGEVHYGWARVGIEFNGPKQSIQPLLTGYAYETQPDKPIRAGDKGKNEATSPTNEASPQSEAKPAGTLGALALGTNGLSVWRGQPR
jgi:hypothetical protein